MLQKKLRQSMLIQQNTNVIEPLISKEYTELPTKSDLGISPHEIRLRNRNAASKRALEKKVLHCP